MDKAPLDMSTEELEDYVAVIGLNDDMYFSLHSSAQSELAVLHGLCEDRFNELAALREELAQSRILASDQALNLKRVKREFDASQQRLTAAEQRNAEILELLRNPSDEMIEVGNRAAVIEMEHDSDLGSCGWISNADEVLKEMLKAALKPTESGASECA